MATKLQIGDLAVEVTQKDIKNVHLSVHPPHGRVSIAAPLHLSVSAIRAFAIGKLSWIRQQQRRARMGAGPCEEKSGGFHVTGGSKSGKTTAFQMAATVWGPHRKGAVLRDWNSTGNALEVAAEEAGDGLLMLDEVHQADPRIVTAAVYDLAGEGGKSRLTRDGPQAL
jgi:hypothetical protein